MKNVLTYAKAHTAAVLAVAFWLVAALHDGNISGPEWLGLPAALGIGGAVAAVPNKPRTDRMYRHKHPADRGITGVGVIAAIVIVVVVLALFGAFHHGLIFLGLIALIACLAL